MIEALPPQPAPPSREANPFATCWTRPGALPMELADGLTTGAIARRLERCGWRGQIVGPHGAGKSTLLRRLAAPIEATGRRVVTVRLNRPGAAQRFDSSFTGADPVVVFLEGFERLPAAARRRVLRSCRRHGAGCVAPTHRRLMAWPVAWPERLPVIARLQPTAVTLLALFERLTRDRPTPVTPADALASFADRRGDLREVWFDLYDRHERAVRRDRTKAVRVS